MKKDRLKNGFQNTTKSKINIPMRPDTQDEIFIICNSNIDEFGQYITIVNYQTFGIYVLSHLS